MIRTSGLVLALLLAVSFVDDTIAVGSAEFSHKLVVEDRVVHLRVPNDDISAVYSIVDKTFVNKNVFMYTLSLNFPEDLLKGKCGRYTLVVNPLHRETRMQVAPGELAEVEVYGRDPCRRNEKCPLHSICEPTEDKCDYNCRCEAGYRAVGSMDGKPACDIDNCKEGIHNCKPDEKCINYEGGYICSPEGDFYIDLDYIAPGRIFDKNDRQFYQYNIHNKKQKNTDFDMVWDVPSALQTKYFEECGSFTINFKGVDREGREARASRTFKVVHNPEVNQCTLDYNSPPELHKFIARCDPNTTDCVAKADCSYECICKPGLTPIVEKGRVTKCVASEQWLSSRDI